ncbi:MAG: type II secretion system F family protein [Propionibacterium sp.]|nr:type II secretion system F family protein [Propionibacterium sp.]
MSMTMEVSILLGSAGLGVLVYLGLAGGDPVRRRALANLVQGTQVAATTSAPPRGLSGSTLRRARPRAWVPRGELRLLDRLLSEAGRPIAWPLERVVSVKLLITVLAGVFGLMFFLGSRSGRALIIAIVLVGVAYAAPELRLWSIGIERREAMTNEMADILDQMSIAVEAGLGFEAALVRVANNSGGVLAGELRRTAQDMQVGQPRRDAYLALARRTRVQAVGRFVRAVIQAEQTGLALRDVLSTQAAEMRVVRRQRIEEQAAKIPVKVIFPLVFCILPVLFIVILGPAGINIMSGFAKS